MKSKRVDQKMEKKENSQKGKVPNRKEEKDEAKKQVGREME